MKRYTRFVILRTDDGVTGNADEGAQVKVFLSTEPQFTTLADVFSDEDGTMPIVQPFFTNILAQGNPGQFTFVIDDGVYDIMLNEDQGTSGRTVISNQEITSKGIYNLSLSEMVAAKYLKVNDVVFISDRDNGRFKIVTGETPNTFNVIDLDITGLQAKLEVSNGKSYVQHFGADPSGATDTTAAVQSWLDFLIANELEGVVSSGTYLIDFVSSSANNGVRISGNGTFKGTGTNTVNLFRLVFVKGKVEINGPTFDGNNIKARPLEIQNTGSTPSTQGEVYIGELTRCINGKNNAPETRTAFGCHIFGGFTSVVFEGEINNVNNSLTSGGVSVGLSTTFTGTGDDWVKSTVITSKARIRNIQNDNISLSNADGASVFAPTDKVSSLTVAPGALFEECQGRSIKSQVLKNSIIGAIIKRSLFDGLAEIDLQYSGGIVCGVQIFHDGTRTNSVIVATQRTTPSNTHCTIIGNELTVTGTPSSNTGKMVLLNITDSSVKMQGTTIRDNKVKGIVDFMVEVIVSNVADVNRVVIDSNWSESIGTAFLHSDLFGAATAQLSVVFTNNSCENSCTGASIVGLLKVEQDYNNFNITALQSSPVRNKIASGIVTPKGEKVIRVQVETGTTDDVDSIIMTNYSPDEILTLINSSVSETITYKDGTGNLKLNGDAVLASVNDTMQVRFDGTNVCEVSRSINGV